MLIDVVSCTIIRVLKGYRDARAAWVVRNNSSLGGGSGSGLLLVVIYAPRRGVVELWRIVDGVRIGSVAGAPLHGVLMSQPAVPSLSKTKTKEQQHGWKAMEPNACWIMDLQTLELRDLTPEFDHLLA